MIAKAMIPTFITVNYVFYISTYKSDDKKDLPKESKNKNPVKNPGTIIFLS